MRRKQKDSVKILRARINYRLRKWLFLPSHLMQLCQFSGKFESLPKPTPIKLSSDSCSALNQNAQGSSNILYGAESRFASINFPHSNAMFARWWQSPFLKSSWDFSDAVVQPEREEKSRKSPLKIFCFSGLIFSTLATMKSSSSSSSFRFSAHFHFVYILAFDVKKKAFRRCRQDQMMMKCRTNVSINGR